MYRELSGHHIVGPQSRAEDRSIPGIMGGYFARQILVLRAVYDSLRTARIHLRSIQGASTIAGPIA